MPLRTPWTRALVEGFVIVASILLAFGIEAWWSERQERIDERESLELIVRDLDSTVARLEEFALISEAAAVAGAEVYREMITPGPIDGDRLTERLTLVGMRRTLRIPAAAYTDLLSTGNLRIIENRAVRDEIIRFHEEMNRTEAIISSNNRAHSDGSVARLFYERGLVVPRPGYSRGVAVATVVDADEFLNDVLGEDVVHPPNRVLRLSRDSEEWAGVQNVSLQAARAHGVNAQLARSGIAEAKTLRDRIVRYLEGQAIEEGGG